MSSTARYARISGVRIKSLSKAKMRQLLSVDDKEVSATTFLRLCRQWKLAESIGMTPEEFKRKKNFWGKDAEMLYALLGIDDKD